MFNNNLLMGAASAGGESLVEVGNSALYTTSSQELERTPSSAGNVDKFTFSTWVYLCNPTSGNTPIFGAINSGANQQRVFTNSSGTLQFDLYLSNSYVGRLITTQVLRDTGWYHIVAVYDSGNSLASNRMILYLNGERITDLATEEYVSVNQDGLICGAHLHQIGMHDGLGTSTDGYMAEAVLLDGTVADPSSFGQYDSTGTFWTPKSSAEIKTLTFGTTGFYLDNTTNAQTDASGTGNNFTNTGSVTTDTHTPTNIEFLMSPINVTDPSDNPVLTNGNRTWSASSSSAQTRMGGNIPFPSSGKWIAGVIITELSDGKAFGIWSDRTDGDGFPSVGGFSGWHRTSVLVAYESDGSTVLSDTNWPQGTTQAVGDQCWIAVDIDNSKTFFGYYDLSADAILWYANDAGNDGNPATGDNPFEENFNCAGMVWAGAAQNSKSFTLVKEADCPFTIPTGYSFLNTTNIASSITRTKSNLEEYFDTTLYEGNGAGQRVGKFLPFTNTFTVGNSGLFDDDNSENLTRNPDAGDTAKWTLSMWVKRGNIGGEQKLWSVQNGSNFDMLALSSDQLAFEVNTASSSTNRIDTTQLFKDTSQWYNFVAVWDADNGTGANRMILYVNGVQATLTTSNTPASTGQRSLTNNGSFVHFIGSKANSSQYFDGYLAETVLINGLALSPSSFGQVDTSTGRWIPKDVSGLTFGTGGFYLNYAASDDVGNDVSGGNNDFTNNNTVVQVADTPTVNANVWNSAESGFSGGTFTNGNRTVQTGTSQYSPVQAGLPISSGKWYTEVVPTATSNDVNFQIGITKGLTTATTQQLGSLANDVGYYGQAGKLIYNGESAVAYGASYAVNDVIGMAIDFDANTITFYKNGASQGAITLPDTSTASTPYFIACNHFDNASNGTFLLRSLSSDWTGSAPAGHLAIIQDNMPTGESYQTAFSWIKNRDATDNHMLFDRVRGIYNDIHSNEAAVEVTNVNTLQRFLNGGVQVGNDVQVNTASESYVAWNWYMETTGTGTSNTDGTINTTATLVDTNIGLSISTYTGTGGNATVGHGLGVAPEMLFVKRTDATSGWYMQNSNLLATQFMQLNALDAVAANATVWNSTFPTSTVFNIGTNAVTNASSATYLALCFAPSQFTSIGTYEGNANANGTFVPTVNSLGIPIQPKFILQRNVDGAFHWQMYDTSRSPTNVIDASLYANSTSAEVSGNSANSLDIVTGGFKCRGTGDPNRSNTSIYLAFGTPIIDVDGRIITGR